MWVNLCYFVWLRFIFCIHTSHPVYQLMASYIFYPLQPATAWPTSPVCRLQGPSPLRAQVCATSADKRRTTVHKRLSLMPLMTSLQRWTAWRRNSRTLWGSLKKVGGNSLVSQHVFYVHTHAHLTFTFIVWIISSSVAGQCPSYVQSIILCGKLAENEILPDGQL